MKKTTMYFNMLLALAVACSCNDSKTKDNAGGEVQDAGAAYSGPPYTVQLEEFVNPKLPDLHSYTHAVYKDKIIMIGGRTNGLHGQTYNFYQANSNKTVYVVDTKNWGDPKGWDVFSMPDTKIVMPGINTDQFRANNAQFFTEDSVLYIVGGMLNSNVPTRLKDPKDPSKGVEMTPNLKATADGKTASGPKTLALITAVNLPALINTVVNNQPMPANSIRQAHDTSLAVTGGELDVMDKTVYLVFGWNFYFTTPPTPQDLYTHQVRTFTYTDNGTTLSISPVTVCATCTDKYANNLTDSGNFRRRDGTMSAAIDPADGSNGLLYYSGVFKDGDINFDSPVWIGKSSAAEQPFVMRSNVYTCQTVPVYSASRKQFYATLMGGMKNATYNGGPIKVPAELTATNAPVTSVAGDFSSIPFTNQFSTVMMDAKHGFKQYLLPDSFPKTITPVVLPADPKDTIGRVVLPAGSVTFNGTESALYWTTKANVLPNGVLDYDAYIKANPKGGSIGYIHGGIQSALINVFGTKAAHYSVASNRLFAVKIVPVAAK